MEKIWHYAEWDKEAFFKTSTGDIVGVVFDMVAENPREWDWLGTLDIRNRNFDVKEGNFDSIYDVLEHYGVKSTGKLSEDVEKIVASAKRRGDVIMPVSVIDHSGMSFYTGLPMYQWDNYCTGFIYVTGEKIRENYNVKRISPKLRARVEKLLTGEVETFNDYVNGNVYGAHFYSKDGKEYDSCYGFYGDDALEYIADYTGEITEFIGCYNDIDELIEETEVA